MAWGLLSVFLTPFWMSLIGGLYVPLDGGAMMLLILKMILLPVVIGLVANRYLGGYTRQPVKALPAVSMFSICWIIAITIAISREELLSIGLVLLGACVTDNLAGFAFGYGGARLLGVDRRDSKTIAIEVGMQNGGMATGLAFNVIKSDLAALVSAVFGPWSAISGSVLASYWRREAGETESPESQRCALELELT